MKKLHLHTVYFVLLIVLISGCSTKKNTWASRTYHSTNTRFNVFFNGAISYDEGLQNILKANQEDYATIIPMYPISRHSNANAATSNMDRTIEKCRKAIKLHSIKKKPTRNDKKANSPEYKLYYNQEEFNTELKKAWLLLAQAEFHKADFLGSAATFSYIARHYATDKDMLSKCELWKARAYAEMGWIYEAEELIAKLNQDDLKRSNTGLFAAVNADLLLKKKRYSEAIPFLELALSKETNKKMKQRFGYLLAQLNQKNGNNKAAYEGYSNVIKTNPPFDMDFNARISRAQLNQGDIASVRKDLYKMLKNPNNKEYLDQLYHAIGNTYLQHEDTTKAIENYKLAIKESTRNGIDKAITLITLGDLYYGKRNYVQAQPCYDEARKIITNEHADFVRVTKRAETLSELVKQNDIVLLQDSLQGLAAMPENERLRVITNLIAQLNADEKAAAEKTLEKTETQQNNQGINFENMTPIEANSIETGGDWYFYNANLMRSGKTDFQKKWGTRKLEDNWRRTIKSTTLFADDTNNSTTDKASTNSVLPNDSITPDNKKPEFYLAQIPTTAAQIKKSNAEIATALYNMGLIYKEKIEDMPIAISTFEEFLSRFKSDDRAVDAYFQLYLIASKQENQLEVERYKTKIITAFPETKQAKILAQPNYNQRFASMIQEQDSIYNLTYKAFNKSNYELVFQQTKTIKEKYPTSALMPKFLFLNALSTGKKNTPEEFEIALTELVAKFPESDVSAMAKDILALLKQGQKATTGSSSGTLISRRDAETKKEMDKIAPQQFSSEKQTKHRLMLISLANTKNMNKIQYNIASFNFSRFMIKDFDMVINKLDTAKSALSVTNLESYDEAVWYVNSISSDSVLTQLFNDCQVQKVIISEENYALMKTDFNLNDYLAFQSKSTETKKTSSLSAPKQKQQEIVLTPKTASTKNEQGIKGNISKPKTVANVLSDEKTTQKMNPLAEQKPTIKETPPTTIVQPKPETTKPTPVIQEEVVPLFKNLFAYRANEAHFVAIYILSGTIDYDKTKAAIDTYNKLNYSLMNLKVSIETVNKKQIIIIGSLSDAFVAKSYLLRMVKEKALFEGLKDADYRNLLGSQKNLNTLMQQNALNTYFEFMKEYYLK